MRFLVSGFLSILLLFGCSGSSDDDPVARTLNPSEIDGYWDSNCVSVNDGGKSYYAIISYRFVNGAFTKNSQAFTDNVCETAAERHDSIATEQFGEFTYIDPVTTVGGIEVKRLKFYGLSLAEGGVSNELVYYLDNDVLYFGPEVLPGEYQINYDIVYRMRAN
jgi:hypothetical protein